MARVFSKKRIIFWASVALSFVLLPLVFDGGFSLSMLSQMGIAIIFVLSYNMLLGQTGLLSFGHAVYFGLGAFVTAHIVNFIDQGAFWFPITFVPIVGGITGLLFALVLGFVTTRRAGTPFAMISLGIGELVYAGTSMFPDQFGGESGISGNRVTDTSLQSGRKLGSVGRKKSQLLHHRPFGSLRFRLPHQRMW